MTWCGPNEIIVQRLAENRKASAHGFLSKGCMVTLWDPSGILPSSDSKARSGTSRTNSYKWGVSATWSPLLSFSYSRNKRQLARRARISSRALAVVVTGSATPYIEFWSSDNTIFPPFCIWSVWPAVCSPESPSDEAAARDTASQRPRWSNFVH